MQADGRHLRSQQLLGAYREKTNFYKQARTAARSKAESPEPSSRLEYKGKDKETFSLTKNVEMQGDYVVDVPPTWMRVVDEVNYDVQKIRTKCKDLAKLHKEHLLPGFDDRVEEEQAIEILTGENTQLFLRCQKKVSALSKLTQLPDQEMRLKHNIQMNLAGLVQDLSGEFRRAQKNYLQRLESRFARVKPGRKSVTMEEMEEGEVAVEGEIYDVGFSERQKMEVDTSVKEIQHRNAEIKNIQKSILELAEIFKEMAVLVVDQGTILDRIDYNIETTSHNLDRGIAELVESEKYQKKTTQKLIMIFLIALIIMAVLVIVVKVMVGGS